MKKGCGFILLSIIGLLAISILYYTLSSWDDDEAHKEPSVYYTRAYVVEVLTFQDESEATLINKVPILEFSVNANYYLDTAYHLRETVKNNDYAVTSFRTGDNLSIAINPKDPKDYELADSLEVIQYDLLLLFKEFRIGLLIVGSLMLFGFLRGLSTTFKYREPPASERIK